MWSIKYLRKCFVSNVTVHMMTGLFSQCWTFFFIYFCFIKLLWSKVLQIFAKSYFLRQYQWHIIYPNTTLYLSKFQLYFDTPSTWQKHLKMNKKKKTPKLKICHYLLAVQTINIFLWNTKVEKSCIFGNIFQASKLDR